MMNKMKGDFSHPENHVHPVKKLFAKLASPAKNPAFSEF